MKKTQFTDLLANIRVTKVSFLSIIVLVSLGIAIFVGLDWTGSALQQTLHHCFEKGKMHDMEIILPYGVTDEEISAFNKVKGVDEIEGRYIGYAFFAHDKDECLAKVISITDDLDTFTEVEGRLPEKENEVAVERGSADTLGIEIGDKISIQNHDAENSYYIGQLRQNCDANALTKEDENGQTYLKNDEVVVTAIVESPEYTSISTSSYGISSDDGLAVSTVFFVKEDALRKEMLPYYNSVLIRSDKCRQYSTFSEEYEDVVNSVKNEVMDTAKKLESNAFEAVTTHADSLLDEQNDKLKKGQEEIDSTQAAIDKGEKTLSSQRAAIENLTVEEIPISDGDAQVELLDAENKLNKAKSDLNEAKNSYNSSKERYDDMKEMRDKLEDPGPSFYLRSNNIGYIYNKLISETVIKLKKTLGGIFLILSILICYSVISRMVSDQRKLIGNKMAQGFFRREITLEYLSYNALATIIGAVAGGLLAYFVVERILSQYVDGSFTYICEHTYFSPGLLLVLILGEFLLAQLITLLACRRIMRQDAVFLMQSEPASVWKTKRYEKSRLWNRMPVFTQAVFNNIIKDGVRVLATLIGIAGCTVLLVSAITLEDNVMASFRCQYDQYYHFDCFVFFDNENKETENELASVFEQYNIPFVSVHRKDGYSYSEDYPKKLTALIAYEDGNEFKNLIHLENSDETATFDYKGMWLPECLKYYYDLPDSIEASYESFTGDTVSSKTKGFYKAYSYNLVSYLDKATYEQLYDESYKPNAFIINARGVNLDDLRESLREVDGYLQLHEYYRSDREDVEVFEIVAKAIVGMYFVASVFMAFFVILNLLTTFVAERRREITVMLINGYSLRKVKCYISIDTAFLTVVGIIIGVVAGVVMGDASLSSFECEYMHLIHDWDVRACIIGAASSAVLTLVMNLVATRKINGFKPSDISQL